MKKLLYLIVSVFMLSCPAWAEPPKTEACYKYEDNGFFYVYFDNNEHGFPVVDGKNCETEVKNKLQEILKDVDMKGRAVLLTGGASSSGGSGGNSTLSLKRVATVKPVLVALGVNIAKEQVAGEANASSTDKWEDRNVLITFVGITTLVDGGGNGGGNGDGGAVADNEKITNVYNQLMALGIFSEKRDVWTDKEGTFNEARLLSDSLAGVALGTAGGLISSHVIKKSQVKKGFEDIQCVIADKPVANWGDTFGVGIQ